MKKYLEDISLALFLIIILILSLFQNLSKYLDNITIVFSISTIILFSFIAIISYRSYVISKKSDFLYFFISYLIVLTINSFILTRKISLVAYNDYYFSLIKGSEILILFFGIFILKERVKSKDLIGIFIKIMIINFIYFLITINFEINIFLVIILYIELIFMYKNILNNNIRSNFFKVIIYKILAEVAMILDEITEFDFYILAYILYGYSLIKLFSYFNKTLNKIYLKQLHAKDKKTKNILKVSTDGIIIIKDYLLKNINDEALKTLDVFNKKNIKGKNIFSVLEGVTKDDIEDAIDIYPEEHTVNLKKGNIINKRLKIIASRINDDYSNEVIIILKNQFSLNEVFYKLSDSINQIIYIFEKGVGYKYISNGIEKILGYNVNDFFENRGLAKEIIIEEDRKKYFDFFNKGENNAFKIRCKTKSDQIRWILVNTSKVVIEEKTYYYGILTDITDQKEKEIKLQNENIKLEDMNTKKDATMSIVSHEIRTPITAIIGFVENILINKASVPEKIINMMNKVYSNSIRLKELVNNVLDFNKLNVNKMEIYKEDIEVKSFVEEIIMNNEMLMEIKNIKFISELKENIFAYADASMFYQIMTNLVSNAIKYNNIDGQIIIACRYLENKVFMKISDTGIGISPENAERVFNEYERARGLKEKGTGLGLPLAKLLVEMNNGKIWFESEIGKGTTFFITFETKRI